MVLLFFVVVILLVGLVLLLMLVGGVITLFAEKPVRIKKPGRKVEISTVNQFENAVPKRPDVIQ
jgi:uncharacterized protein YabE (DUF348 family)